MTEKKMAMPARYMRNCGQGRSHPADWTLDLKRLDGVIESYCLGCIIDKLGLKPVDKFRINIGKNNKPEIIRVKE